MLLIWPRLHLPTYLHTYPPTYPPTYLPTYLRVPARHRSTGCSTSTPSCRRSSTSVRRLSRSGCPTCEGWPASSSAPADGNQQNHNCRHLIYVLLTYTYLVTNLLTHLLARSLARSLARPLTRSLSHSLTRSLAHSLTRSLAHSLTRSLTNLGFMVVKCSSSISQALYSVLWYPGTTAM